MLFSRKQIPLHLKMIIFLTLLQFHEIFSQFLLHFLVKLTVNSKIFSSSFCTFFAYCIWRHESLLNIAWVSSIFGPMIPRGSFQICPPMGRKKTIIPWESNCNGTLFITKRVRNIRHRMGFCQPIFLDLGKNWLPNLAKFG